MYKIEFNDDMTLNGIIESFNNLQEVEIESFIEIDGVNIYWNDENRDVVLKELLNKHKSNIKKTDNIDIEENNNAITNIEVDDDTLKILNRI